MTDDDGEALRDALAERLEGLSAPERRAEFLGLLQDHLPEGTDAILVGGALVELLTEGQYVTGDVDLIGPRAQIESLLVDAGFERSGRLLVDEALGLAVEVVSSSLDPSCRSERIRWRDHTLHVLSIEDLIVDRLCGAKFWESSTDQEQAMLLYNAHWDRLEMERLWERAAEEDVDDLVEDLEAGAREPPNEADG